MISFSDLMHDIGGEYTKLKMGGFDVNEDLLLLIQGDHVKLSDLDRTIAYAKSYLERVKQYMASATGLLNLVNPLIIERVGTNNELYLIKTPNDQITNLAIKAIEDLGKKNLIELNESQLIEIIKITHGHIENIRGLSKLAEDIFFNEKDKLYKIIDRTTEISFGNSYKLMLLDDEPDICVYLKNHLIKRGFKVETAISAQEATDLALRFHPQIALLDIKLGDSAVNGIEVLKFIKKNIRTCRCYMLTMVDDKYILEKCKELGSCGSLSKPINVQEITNTLYKAVREILSET